MLKRMISMTVARGQKITLWEEASDARNAG